MTKHATTMMLVAAIAASFACRSRPRPQPGDPMLDAIRAEEREGHLSYVESQGKHLFAHYCATCHGDDGHGDGQNASNLTPPPPDLASSATARDAALVRKVIAQGSVSIGRSALSPPWGRSLSPQEIDYLVAYCLSASRKTP